MWVSGGYAARPVLPKGLALKGASRLGDLPLNKNKGEIKMRKELGKTIKTTKKRGRKRSNKGGDR